MGESIRDTSIAKARAKVDINSREFNASLWRIATGHLGPGGIGAELATITGFSREAIRSRADQAGRDYPPDAAIPLGGNLTHDDLDYMNAILHDCNSPETREFFGGINGVKRRRPDNDDARVKRERCGDKLISVAIGPINN